MRWGLRKLRSRGVLCAAVCSLAAALPLPAAFADDTATYVTGVSVLGSGQGTYDSDTGKYYQLHYVGETDPNTGAAALQFKRYDLFSSTDGTSFAYDRTLVDAADVTLYTDDFDNVDNDIAANWAVDNGTWLAADDGTGVYRKSGSGSGIAYYNGGSDWTDYAYAADVRREGDGAALLGRYQDSTHYYQLIVREASWELNKNAGGAWTTLASGATSTDPTDFYHLKLVFSGTDIKAYIGDENVADVTDGSYSAGTVALRSADGQGSFDNVRVVRHMLLDDFEQGAGNWTAVKGAWQTYTETYANGNPDDAVYEQTGGGSGIATAGGGDWSDYALSAYVKRSGAGAAILGRYQDENNYYQLIIQSGQWLLNKHVGGSWTTLASGNHTFSSTNYYHLKMIFSGSTITVGIWGPNGQAIINSPDSANPVTVTDTSLAAGKVGLRANTGQAFFDSVTVGGLLSDALFRSQHWIQSPATGHWSIWTKRQYGTNGDGSSPAAKNLVSLTSMNGKIDGDYALVYAGHPDGNPSGDIGLFTDDDAARSRYIVSADTTNGYVNLYKLNADNDRFDGSASLSGHTDGLINHINCGTSGIKCYSVNGKHNMEAVSLLKYNGYYYIFGSGVSGWNPNQQQYTYASDLAGPWADCVKIGDASGYHSQLFSVKQIDGSSEHSFLFSATRNGAMWGGPNTLVYLPMYLNNPTLAPGEGFSFSTNYYDYTIVDNTTGEVKGYNYDIGTKLAVSGVSAAYSDGVNVPGNTVDGDDATYWINDNTLAGGSITFDLGAAHTVKAVKLRLDPDNAGGNFKRVSRIKIEVGDGTHYTTVYDKDGNGIGGITAAIDWLQPIQLQDKTQSGRYVRISLAGANSEGSSNYRFKLYEAEVWGDSANDTPVADESFTADTTGAVPSDWTVAADSGTSGTVQPDGGDNRLELNDASASGHVSAEKAFTAEEGATVSTTFDFKLSDIGAGDTIALTSGATAALAITNAADGLVFSDSAGADQLIAPVDANTWYRMRIVANTDADTFDIYLSSPSDPDLNAHLVRGGGRMDLAASDIPNVDGIRFRTSDGSSDTFRIDNLTVEGPLF